MKLPKRGADALVYSLPLIGYGVVAVFLGMRHREMMNADAMVYIRRAGYLLHGDFYYFLSEHWSLMLSWLIAPLMAMGIDGLYAARIVNGCIGALYMVCFLALARRLRISAINAFSYCSICCGVAAFGNGGTFAVAACRTLT